MYFLASYGALIKRGKLGAYTGTPREDKGRDLSDVSSTSQGKPKVARKPLETRTEAKILPFCFIRLKILLMTGHNTKTLG